MRLCSCFSLLSTIQHFTP